MRKLYLLFLLSAVGITGLKAQQDAYKFRLGVYSSMMNYYGDLNQRLISPNKRIVTAPLEALSYGISLEKSFSQSWSGKLFHTSGAFYANDRAIHWDGSPDADRSNYARSLNAKTNIKDLSLIFTYSLDNDYVFSRRAFISPYFTFGLGYTDFTVYGDLYDASGNRYHYWSDRSIRSDSETSPSASAAVLVEQDGVYETNLSRLNTERDYKTTVLNIPFGAGLKFRISSRFNLNLDFTVRYAFTDYLDDVSGEYRTSYDNEQQEYAANPTNRSAQRRGSVDGNDFYSYTSVSLHYNFGKRTEKFKAPKIYPSAYYLMPASGVQPGARETVELEAVTALAPGMITEVKALDDEAFTPIPVTKDLAERGKGEEVIEHKVSEKSDSTASAQETPHDKTIDKYALQDDTIRQLEYEVKKLKLQNELYELRRDSPIPEIRRKFMTDSITSRSLYSTGNTAGRNSSTITNDSIEDASGSAENAANADSADRKSDADSHRERATPSASDSVRMSRMQSQLEYWKEVLSGRSSSNLGQEERYRFDQLRERIEALSNELKNSERGTRTPGQEVPPPAVSAPGDSENREITNLERKIADLSDELGRVLQSRAPQDSINDVVLARLARSETELSKRISALDSGLQNIAVREDSIREARVAAERDSLRAEVRRLRQTVAGLRAATPDTVEREVITIPEIPKTEVFFEVNSSALSANDEKRIKEIARIITRYPQIRVTIKGFTDQTGSPEYNRVLSEKRARAVEAVLLSADVSANRITMENVGVDNDLTSKASQYGRRVEIVFSSK